MKMRINTLMVLLLKSAKLIKIVKSAKVLKAGFSILTMAIFAACHSVAMGITFGIGLMVLLFIHELGHVIALKEKGFDIKLPIFIPFVGVVISAPKFENRETEAYVGFGGPLLGTISALACAVPYIFTLEPIWLTLSFVGIIINLFNMIPISPLDGGRITQVIDRNFKYLGLGLLLLFTLLMGEPGMLLIWIAVIIDIDKIRMKKRLYGALGIWVTMAILTFCGVGRAFIANVIDTVCALLIIIPIAGVLFVSESGEEKEKRLIELEEELRDKRPDTIPKNKFMWLTLWLSLTALQIGILVIQGYLISK